MRLATLREPGTTSAVRIDGGTFVPVNGFSDVGALLADPDWVRLAQDAGGPSRPLSEVTPASWAPVVPRPGKIVCVGLNYRPHILEMGRQLPDHPTLFAKYAEALIGAYDPIVLPAVAAGHLDWEGELAVVVGRSARGLTAAESEGAIAGYSILNDVTARDYQYRTTQWLQGKTFESTSPFGPVLVTTEEYEAGSELRTDLDGEVVQRASTDDLLFSPSQLVSYISHILTLRPGDVIATGTPGGVGHARNPQRYLAEGQVLSTSIEGIGVLRNEVVAESCQGTQHGGIPGAAGTVGPDGR